jgi:uncharacterized SAM-binding protein YcdF (DUF218 family)
MAPDAVIVLGNANDEKGNLHPISLERITTGIRVFKEKKAKLLMTSGGKGSHFNNSKWDHCDLMRTYAIKQGVPAAKTKALLLAQTTVDEILSIRYLAKKNKWKSVCIVTSPWHLLRVRIMAKLALDIHVEYYSSSIRFHQYGHFAKESLKLLPSLSFLRTRMKQPFPKELVRG